VPFFGNAGTDLSVIHAGAEVLKADGRQAAVHGKGADALQEVRVGVRQYELANVVEDAAYVGVVKQVLPAQHGLRECVGVKGCLEAVLPEAAGLRRFFAENFLGSVGVEKVLQGAQAYELDG